MRKPDLSERERRFVEAYMGKAAGNGTQAARDAGYKGTSQVLSIQASRLLDKASVQAAIDERRGVLETAAIADAKERRQLLSRHARNLENPMAAIKAVDVLNKMDGVYIERLQHEGTVTVDVAGARDRLTSTLARIATRVAGRMAGGSE